MVLEKIIMSLFTTVIEIYKVSKGLSLPFTSDIFKQKYGRSYNL